LQKSSGSGSTKTKTRDPNFWRKRLPQETGRITGEGVRGRFTYRLPPPAQPDMEELADFTWTVTAFTRS
jgi:hypothetical protein